MTREHQKVTASHLARDAFLYVRQSTLRQVAENTESTHRQYELRTRAHALGWPVDRVVVIDSDLGQSGADRDREGFRTLVGEVSMGRAGIVLGLEVSRLARNSSDWHRLIELCAMTGTLILDEDGLYDPCSFNDRLILGLKGQMSEAELHFLRARLQGGIISRAQRGALKLPLPIGFAYDPLDNVVLDPDAQVRQSITLLFDTFRRTGSALATVKAFRSEDLLFPRRLRSGSRKGEVIWAPLTHSRVLQILHHPRYAGAFMFGRTRSRRLPDGTLTYRTVPLAEVDVLLRDQHDAYISWERFEANRQRLADNSASGGGDRRPPREGPALLQGLALCGRCGSAMTIRYHARRAGLVPDYLCQKQGIEHATAVCQHVPGRSLDRAIGELMVDLMTPATLEVALRVQEELEARAAEVDAWHDQRVQRAREEADMARLRFMKTHPDNRIVADVLEGEWNEKLRLLDEVRRDSDRRRAEDRARLADDQRQRILKLACDFPRLWNDPATPDRERKRMVQLMIEDVTITDGDEVELGIRLRGGATRHLMLPRDLTAPKLYATPSEALEAIDTLLEDHCEREIAGILVQRGLRTGYGKPFTPQRVRRVCRDHGLKPRYQRLRERGLLTRGELAERLGVSPSTVNVWRRRNLLVGTPWNDKNECLFEMPDNPPVRCKHKFKRTPAAPHSQSTPHGPDRCRPPSGHLPTRRPSHGPHTRREAAPVPGTPQGRTPSRPHSEAP